METEILNSLIWYITLIIIGGINFPLTQLLLKKLPDRGYAFSKVIGILLITYLSWVIPSLKILTFDTTTIYIAIFFVILLNLFIYKNHTHKAKVDLKIIFIEELIFVLTFAGMIWYRYHNPNIHNIEKFMDFGILNGLLRTNYFPPEDIWYSGKTVNYYYVGHTIYAVLQKITSITPGITYNLSIGTIFALSASQVYSLVNYFIRNKLLSLVGPIFLNFSGNLDFIYKVLLGRKKEYFYAEARSLIEYTINEFPAYSFIISDLHAHIINIPNVLLTIILIINFEFKKYYILLLSIFFGVLYTVNSWDFLLYLPFLGLVILLKSINNEGKVKSLIKSASYYITIIVISYILFLPFHLNFSPAVSGIGFVSKHSPLSAVLIMFGGFLIFIIPFLTLKVKEFFNEKYKIQIAIILSILGLLYMTLPDIVYLKDIYDSTNPPYYRANSVFKIWYQAWIIFSIATPVAIYTILKHINSLYIKKAFLGFTFFILTWLISYFAIGINYEMKANENIQGLDGTKFLEKENEDYYNLIKWIDNNIKGQPTVLEAEGKAYTHESVVSSFTGLPTIVGWTDHEFGWRNNWPEISSRLGDIKTIYTSNSAEQVNNLIDEYNIKYVVIGNIEKKKYGSNAGSTVKTVGDVMYKTGELEVIKVKDF